MKKIFWACLIFIVVLTMSVVPSFAIGGGHVYPGAMDDHGSADTTPLFEMSEEELNNLRDSSKETSTRAVTNINKYATITASGNQHPVYASASTTASVNGYVGYRERIYVIQEWSQGFYYIKFLNASNAVTYGYIQTSKVYIPSYNFARPITTGTVSQLYTSSHNGVDVATGYGTNLYAAASGTAAYKYVSLTQGGVTNYTNYGRYIELTSGSYMFRYAHLKSFSNNVSTPDYASLQVNTWDYRPTLNTVSVSQGSVIGYSGNSGNSTGPHLHFEVLVNGTNYDPYIYVVFPDIGY